MIITNNRLNLEVDIVRSTGCFVGSLEVYEILSG